jgi:hypothetical protein
VGQEFIEAMNGMVGDTAENIAEPGKRVDLHEFARCDETAEYGSRLASVVTAEESPVIAAHSESPQRAFRGIVSEFSAKVRNDGGRPYFFGK